MLRFLQLLVLLMALGACAPASGPGPAHAGGKAEPKSDVERDLLTQLDDWPAEGSKTVGGVKVVAEPPYIAASGSTCRWLTIEGEGESRRLACKDRDDTPWFYAPSVLSSEGR